MTAAIQPAAAAGGNGGSSGDLADVIETILDKGLVIDAHVSVGVVGIQILTIDARVVVASVDTYLRFAEAVNRLDLSETEGKELPDIVHGPAGGVLEKAGETLGQLVDGGKSRREPARRQRERKED